MCASDRVQALAKEAKRKQEEEKSRMEEMKRQEKKALEEADASRFKGKESKEPKTLTQFQIYEQKSKREAQAKAAARQEVSSSHRHVLLLRISSRFRTRVCSTWKRGTCRCVFSLLVLLLFQPAFLHAAKENPNHVLRDEAARAAEEGRDFVSARGVDQALQVRCIWFPCSSCHLCMMCDAGAFFRN